jgi:hypothetical protein
MGFWPVAVWGGCVATFVGAAMGATLVMVTPALFMVGAGVLVEVARAHADASADPSSARMEATSPE